MQICTATFAREWQRSLEASLKDVQSFLQQRASKPEGPAASCVRREAERMAEASMASKMMGCTWGGTLVGIRISLIAGM